jgi:hypothetical protein
MRFEVKEQKMPDRKAMLPRPGEETSRLARLFRSGTWKGRMVPGALGPGSPELPTRGTLNGQAVGDGWWFLCDIESTAGTGDKALTWKGHLVVGWDPSSNAYKGLLVDNVGMMVPLNGELTTAKFVLTSARPLPLLGTMTSARFTWDFSDPNEVKFTNEHQVNGGPWTLWEEETITFR